MRAFERYTASRGRAAVPDTFDRTRRCRRCRACSFVWTLMRRPPSTQTRDIVERCSCALPDLPDDVLVGVADALALVRLGRPPLADLRGRLADHLLGDAAHDDLRGLW